MSDPVTDAELITVFNTLSQDARAILTALVAYAAAEPGDTTFSLSTFSTTVPNIAKQARHARACNRQYQYITGGGF